MPLTAKVMNPAFAGSTKAKMYTSDAPEQIRELPGDEKEDVLFDTLFGLRTVELNRPKVLNSLNGSMVRKIVPRLQEWAKSDMANVVVIKGAGEKAFCAGGDVTSLAKDNKLGEEGQQRSIDYFALEYKLDHLIATYTKPYVAIMDGFTMGGGVGLSLHAPFRIATEKTVFAMPETTIGFFPDVGASFFLPRMAGATGMYLALTSERLTGVNVYYAGIATHYIHSTSLPALERRLAELRFNDYDSLDERLDLIDSTIEEYTTGLPHDQPMLLSGPLRRAIDACFSADTLNEVVKRLSNHHAQSGPIVQWAEKTLLALKSRSPTSLHVTFQQMKLGRKWSIKETFQREHQIASKFMRHPDFTEGVDALLIRKDKTPNWAEPSKLEDVQNPADLTRPFFEVDKGKTLKLLTKGDFEDYPHRRFGLPNEGQIESIVKKGNRTIPEVVGHFVREKRGKQGVKEMVEEVLARRAYSVEGGKAAWYGSESTE
ncbi:3-hydroxyisobutyryl-CoA hydrolase, mitochondrial [Lachnellula occidentalis]|uniref:3-hydroxyisobutyryl-CoA hydrolase n=1 Tax=Lachnellula occidentalis TaxID=215460 RepID=A0A8H8UCH5_9HELO|nr:3-hydroxyisobutyryl-CoA hydrolase, mitochondrial [Lachnellula occidentalis]